MTFGDFDLKAGFERGFATSVVSELIDPKAGYADGPERALLGALLFDGVQSFVSYMLANTEAERSKFREAYSWVMNRTSDYSFAFEPVCEALGINPEYLRLGLINATNSLLQSVSKSRRNS